MTFVGRVQLNKNMGLFEGIKKVEANNLHLALSVLLLKLKT